MIPQGQDQLLPLLKHLNQLFVDLGQTVQWGFNQHEIRAEPQSTPVQICQQIRESTRTCSRVDDKIKRSSESAAQVSGKAFRETAGRRRFRVALQSLRSNKYPGQGLARMQEVADCNDAFTLSLVPTQIPVWRCFFPRQRAASGHGITFRRLTAKLGLAVTLLVKQTPSAIASA